jgi:hypothetical protein
MTGPNPSAVTGSHEAQRWCRVGQAECDAHGADPDQAPAALGGEEQTESDRQRVERRAPDDHGATGDEAVLQDA